MERMRGRERSLSPGVFTPSSLRYKRQLSFKAEWGCSSVQRELAARHEVLSSTPPPPSITYIRQVALACDVPPPGK